MSGLDNRRGDSGVVKKGFLVEGPGYEAPDYSGLDTLSVNVGNSRNRGWRPDHAGAGALIHPSYRILNPEE